MEFADVFPLMVAFFFIGGGIITIIAMVKEVGKHRPVRLRFNADMYLVEDETQMRVVQDVFLRTHTTREKVSSSSSSNSNSSSRK